MDQERKVFAVNDMDRVCALDAQSALDWYNQECFGGEEIETHAEEVDMNDLMYYPIYYMKRDGFTVEEVCRRLGEMSIETHKFNGDDCWLVPYWLVLQFEPWNGIPYIISTQNY